MVRTTWSAALPALACALTFTAPDIGRAQQPFPSQTPEAAPSSAAAPAPPPVTAAAPASAAPAPAAPAPAAPLAVAPPPAPAGAPASSAAAAPPDTPPQPASIPGTIPGTIPGIATPPPQAPAAAATAPVAAPSAALAPNAAPTPVTAAPVPPPAPAQSPRAGTPTQAASTPPPAPPTIPPVTLDNPVFVDTARVVSGDRVLSLDGLLGLSGAPLDQLRDYLSHAGNQLRCGPQASGNVVCSLPDGTDIALAILRNGAATATPNAPAAYQDQQKAAQQARAGVWHDLPPPPLELDHPSVLDTATLTYEDTDIRLDGIEGLGAPYASQLSGYIASKGGQVTCNPQGASGAYVCLLSNHEDIAEVALTNGAARVAPDATDAYRRKQAFAMTNRLGIWQAVSPQTVAAFIAEPPPPHDIAADTAAEGAPEAAAEAAAESAYIPVPDEPADGITYVAGVPEIEVDGAPAVLVYGGAVGWGYYDHDHFWRRAPDAYWRHMEHYHPEGRGLRGYRDPALRHVAAHGDERRFGGEARLAHAGSDRYGHEHETGTDLQHHGSEAAYGHNAEREAGHEIGHETGHEFGHETLGATSARVGAAPQHPASFGQAGRPAGSLSASQHVNSFQRTTGFTTPHPNTFQSASARPAFGTAALARNAPANAGAFRPSSAAMHSSMSAPRAAPPHPAPPHPAPSRPAPKACVKKC